MPAAHTLLAFSLIALAFIAIPGPSNLYVMARGLQSGSAAAIAGAAGCAAGHGSPWRSYRQGLYVELGNPKVALFFLALSPQFVHSGWGPTALQVLVGLFYLGLGGRAAASGSR